MSRGAPLRRCRPEHPRTFPLTPRTWQKLLRHLLPEGVDDLLFSPEKGEDNSVKLVPGIAERVRA